MNYYERIQRSMDYIESNLEDEIDLTVASRYAYMSLSSFYRMFFALVGYSVKEYVRLRRISLAAAEITESNSCIIDIAIKYDFDSSDSFSRTFRRITGYLPSEFRRHNKKYSFERIDIMDKYFEIQDKKSLEMYPDIKVLKKLETLKVAYYNYYGIDPESNAFKVVIDWLIEEGIDINEQNSRIFGYNNPSPVSEDQKEYGYEVCITIKDDMEVKHPLIRTKHLEGGLYAVTSVKRKHGEDMGEGIVKAWKRFNNWLSDSKYIHGGHQWLEEHLGFDDALNHTGGIDLYMPIVERSTVDFSKTFTDVDRMWTATYTANGPDAAHTARDYLMKWIESEGLTDNIKNHRVFAYYNHERIGCKDFFFKIHITVDRDFKPKDQNIMLEEFKGGYYAVMKTKFKHNGSTWGEFMKWISSSKEYRLGDHWFFEEYKLDRPEITNQTEMLLYMPVKVKLKDN